MEGARDVAMAIIQEIDKITQDITDFKIREVNRQHCSLAGSRISMG